MLKQGWNHVYFSEGDLEKLSHVLAVAATETCACDRYDGCSVCYARELGSELFSDFESLTDRLGRSVAQAAAADVERKEVSHDQHAT